MDLQELMEKLHHEAAATQVFALKGIRTRAVCRRHYRVADGHASNGFVHVTARIGHGRSLAQRQAAGERLFAVLRACLQSLYEQGPLAISFEIQELHPQLTFRQSNLQEWMQRRSEAGPA